MKDVPRHGASHSMVVDPKSMVRPTNRPLTHLAYSSAMELL
jgi:hypothetical protein